MKIATLILAATTNLVAAQASGVVDPVAQFRVGFDTNPAGCGRSSASVIGGDDSLTFAAGIGFGFALPTNNPSVCSAKLGYAGETVRFDGRSSEDFTTHRLSLAAQVTRPGLKFSLDGSTLYVDGDRGTPVSVSTTNGNSTAIWRERREQLQHRLKLQATLEQGTRFFRSTATVLDYDYRTVVQPGHVTFADRSDRNLGADFGWKLSPRSAWTVGARIGEQSQDTIPLPNGEFEYSNKYRRLVVGWEGKAAAQTTVSFAAGPDFRHYDGNVDPRVFIGRDRASLWFEGNLATKLAANLSLTAKTVRMYWLSSTGKSAYIDTNFETSLNWEIAPSSTFRFSAKAHRCDYFPTLRDDWEGVLGLGVTHKLSSRVSLTTDLLAHRGWNDIDSCVDRRFDRFVLNLGTTIKL